MARERWKLSHLLDITWDETPPAPVEAEGNIKSAALEKKKIKEQR